MIIDYINRSPVNKLKHSTYNDVKYIMKSVALFSIPVMITWLIILEAFGIFQLSNLIK